MTLSNSNHLDNTNDLKSQLSNLEQQLISFEIVDRQGIKRATVKDIYYDSDADLNLLLELYEANRKLSLRRLGSEDICQMNLENKLIISNLSNQQLEDLPIYQPVPAHIKDALTKSPEYNDCDMNPNLDIAEDSNNLETIDITLLEEKLEVVRRKQKVGEVIVRKKVETRIVEIPLRREKLVVERIGKNPQQLAEVVINEEKVNGFGYDELEQNRHRLNVTRSQHFSLKQAQSILDAIANSATDNLKIRLEIVSDSSDSQQQYQNICDRALNSNDSSNAASNSTLF